VVEFRFTPEMSVSPRVVGGSTTTAFSYPFIANLILPGAGPDLRYQHTCGGTLIAPKWVMTAAHCIDHSISSGYRIAMYRHNLRLTDAEEHACSRSDIEIERIQCHPDYGIQHAFDSDLCLLELTEAFTCSGLVLPSLDDGTASATGTTATVVGWGALIDHEDEANANAPWPWYPDELQHADMTILGDTCYDLENTDTGLYTITSKMICASELSEPDACWGDSGGPLLVGNVVVGIASFGAGCGATRDIPGVYTRVSQFTTWINAIMSAASPPPPSPFPPPAPANPPGVVCGDKWKVKKCTKKAARNKCSKRKVARRCRCTCQGQCCNG